MTLDEAIKHCEEIQCLNGECKMEHQQLAEWLKELKELKENKSFILKMKDIWNRFLDWGTGGPNNEPILTKPTTKLESDIDKLISFTKENSIFDNNQDIYFEITKSLEELKKYRENYPYPYIMLANIDKSELERRSFPPYICPACGIKTHFFRNNRSEYCPYCGQRVRVKR